MSPLKKLDNTLNGEGLDFSSRPLKPFNIWSWQEDSNPQHADYDSAQGINCCTWIALNISESVICVGLQVLGIYW